ncbi:MAG: ribonuclease H-like domain-containing protein [Deltaproteobacteria bacterium]|nr:ribonuclease H-like domain-containing protein [Deltaproteobacteria bacterium]
MIENSFVHIQGIGPKTEKAIWQKGIIDWKGFLSHSGVVISAGKDAFIRAQLEDSVAHYGDIKYFADRLPASDRWRMFGNFNERSVYLDIETSGDYSVPDTITVIGLYDGSNVYTFVNGRNLHEFEIAISSYDLVITFNGSGFDLPIIKKYFPNISLPACHIDLKFLLKRLGYSGGLKKIEKDLGITRDDSIEGMNGFDAVRLWNAYTWGDKDALELLIRYNTADIVNLKPLMENSYKRMKKLIFSF